MKSSTVILPVRPRVWVQLNRVQISKTSNLFFELIVSLKIRSLCSFHNCHIKNNGAIFKSPYSASQTKISIQLITLICNTQWLPNNLKTRLHKSKTTSEWSNEWSTVSSLHQHISLKGHSPSGCPNKEKDPLRCLSTPNSLLKEKICRCTSNNLIIRAHRNDTTPFSISVPVTPSLLGIL